MLSFLSALTVKDVIIYGLGSIVTLLLYIYKKDMKLLDEKVSKVTEDIESKLKDTRKSIDLRLQDVCSDIDKLNELTSKVSSNEKDIEWLKRSEHKSDN